MKLQKEKRKNKSPLLLSLLVLLIVSGGMFAYMQYERGRPDSTQSPHASDNQQSENLKDNPDDKQQIQNTDRPTEPEAVDPTTNQQKVQLESSSDKSSDTLFIRGGINYPVNGGSCYAKLTGPSGQTVTKETGLLPGPASTDCKTISIPLSELSPGEWSFTLNYTSDIYIGVSTSVSFSI